MNAILGVVLLVAGVCCGLYVGVWWAFIGGIVDVITEIRAEEMQAMGIAIGAAKVFFAGVAGWASGILLALPGLALLKDS